MANLKNIADLPVAESAEGLNLIVNDNGAAKQIAASAVGTSSWNDLKDKPFYSETDEDVALLSDKLLSATDENGEPLYNGAVAISLMLFVLIYLPCIGTLATIKNETGSWWWAVFVAIYTIVLAWVVSFVVYQSIIHNIWQETVVACILLLVLLYVVLRIIRKLRQGDSDSPCSACSASGCHGCPYKS